MPLPAAELVRIAVAQRGIEPGALELRAHVVVEARAVGEAVHARAFADNAVDAQARVEARIGVLKDHLCLQARGTPLGGGQRAGKAAVEPDLAGRGREQAREQTAEGRFPAARFAHEPDHFAAPHPEIDFVDRVHDGGRMGQPRAFEQARGGVRAAFAEALADAVQRDERH
ncbi:hypothetical protein LMG28688_03686 [Paraburkholderia caffeinitolerans]|uniref:Uncharacterized protein n=1 Tax=Paraburkholderia caffeinitolerans TaxID=1723730 RepID=A0A6J5G5E1_9BURK|nr:hypothetical protein LMG28688_03686 [Paraburkholderia caffeinitolerans]